MSILAILLSGVWAMIIGAIWYSPLLFAKPWMRMSGLTKKDLEMTNAQMARTYGTTFLMTLIGGFLLSRFFIASANTLGLNLFLVICWWVIFTLIPMSIADQYQTKKFVYSLINAGYQLVVFIGMAVIFTYFPL